MTKTKVIIAIAFVLALGAGVAVGMLGARNMPTHRGRSSWLTEELHLSADQQKQMQEIWSNVLRGKGREHMEQVRALQQQREGEIVALLTAEQKARYEQINQQFDQRVQEFARQRDEAFEQAVEKTKQILGDSQRQKYDELLKKMRTDRAERRGPGGPGGGLGAPPRGHGRPGTAPSEPR